MVVHCAILWGWRDPCRTYGDRLRIAKAACKLVAYDLGYEKPLAHTQLPHFIFTGGVPISLFTSFEWICGSTANSTTPQLKSTMSATPFPLSTPSTIW